MKRLKRFVIAALIVGSGLAIASDRPKALYKVTRLSTTQVGISCLNNAWPKAQKFGDVVILSCSESPETTTP